MRQHLTCVQAAKAVCAAKVQGDELGSQTLVFEPGPVGAGEYTFNVGSAGSCTLVLQTVLPALMLASALSQVALTGGTHNPMVPPFHFLEHSFAPLLRRLGIGIDLTLRYDNVTEVFTSFGEKGVSSEHVSNVLVKQVKAYFVSDGALGPHLVDQWMLPLALAVAGNGREAAFTCSELTPHARTNIGVIERFLPVLFGTERAGQAWRVRLTAGETR